MLQFEIIIFIMSIILTIVLTALVFKAIRRFSKKDIQSPGISLFIIFVFMGILGCLHVISEVNPDHLQYALAGDIAVAVVTGALMWKPNQSKEE